MKMGTGLRNLTTLQPQFITGQQTERAVLTDYLNAVKKGRISVTLDTKTHSLANFLSEKYIYIYTF